MKGQVPCRTNASRSTQKSCGLPCIRGLRIPVASVVAMVADGMSAADIVAELPDLVLEDIPEALR
jgi:uncharacterized protein (DUF433 family)